MNLKILYLDDALCIVYKPAGMIVHRVAGQSATEPALLQSLRDQLGQKIYPVHRLDQPTAGLVIVGLQSSTAAHLVDQFAMRRVEKAYQALVLGTFPSQMTLDSPLDRARTASYRLPTNDAFESNLQPSTTEVQCLAHWSCSSADDTSFELSLLEVLPKTGRSHQIRRHLCDAGFPIISDYRYGDPPTNRSVELFTQSDRMMLIACYLEFHHPIDRRKLYVRTDPDCDYVTKLDLLRSNQTCFVSSPNSSIC